MSISWWERWSLWWWVAWVLVCVHAGALAGWGLVEFYPEYPEGGYDGGFMGDLVFFGGFLALGQAPFVAVFVWFCACAAGSRSWRGYTAAVAVAIAWPVAGFVGWTFGSFVEVSVSEPLPLYSDLRVVVGSVRWLVVGVMEGFVLATAVGIFSASEPRGSAGRPWAVLLGLGAAWVAGSVIGGLLFEWWEALEVAARSNELNEAICGYLEGLGVAENVARVVVPYALFLPLLYGVPTGWVFSVLRGTVVRGER